MIVIRPARVEDAQAMGRVMVDTYMEAHHEQMPEAAWHKRKNEWTYEVSARSWERSLRELAEDENLHECYFVAEDASGAVVGLAMGQPAWETAPKTTGEVCALYVHPGYQGHGIGRRLVQAVARQMAGWGFTILHISVLKANAPARHFYEAIGGQPIGERTFDEEGFLLPGVTYAWPDIRMLIPTSRETTEY